MAVLATQPVNRAGMIPAYVAATGGGDSFLPDDNTFLHVKNGSGGSITVTIVTPGTDPVGNPVADNAIAIAGGAEKMIGPFPAVYYADPTTGNASVTYSGVTSLTVGVIKLAKP